jgi:membrane dipeptidase
MIPIFDGHNDALMTYAPAGKRPLTDFFTHTPDAQIDLPRARAGGMVGGLFAVFIEDASSHALMQHFDPSKPYVMDALDLPTARESTAAQVANLFRLERQSAGQMRVVRTADELEGCIQQGIFAAVLHFEGAEAIDPDLHALEVYYQAGLRSLGLVWSRPTLFAEGVPFIFPHSPDTGGGLTDAGRNLVRACNQLGILVDLSHLNEKGFWDVAAFSTRPLVATHSNVWNLCQLPRNLTDRQLDAIKESGGVVGLNLVTALARADAADNPDTAVAVYVRHVQYMVERMGVEHVALGADYGAAWFPHNLPDVSSYPRLMEALGQAGFSESELHLIGWRNWLHVLRETWIAPA